MRVTVMLILILVVLGIVIHLQGAAEVNWTNKSCWTNSCVADTLNGLSPDRAAEAKLTTWKDATYVWFRGK